MSNSLFSRKTLAFITAGNLGLVLLIGLSAFADNVPGKLIQDDNTKVTIESPNEIDYSTFLVSIQQRVKKHWLPPKCDESKRAVVSFKVNRKGNLINLKLTESTGLKEADQAALKAVKDAVPFGPLPKGAPGSVLIEYTFDYNVLSGGLKSQ